jgi:hypothetical protein
MSASFRRPPPLVHQPDCPRGETNRRGQVNPACTCQVSGARRLRLADGPDDPHVLARNRF